MYTLDTNAIIYYLKDEPGVVTSLNTIFTQNVPIYISTITEIELFGFSKLSEQETAQIEAILRTVAIIPVDSRIARTAGFIRRNYHINIADSTIAATALFTGTTLLTRNIRDFRKIPNLSLQKV
ncbi:MAG: type II toxin-antitoxin system VapC family toxin [Deltaproteobacteria bacterium]|nr:type II toxin-antitoxin system VapC family toxin [Deltaproteobacteria bacterium]